MQAIPYTGALPIAEPTPTGHPAAAAQFLGQHFPRDATFEDTDDARKRGSIGQARPPAFGLGWLWRQERFDDRP